MAMTAPQIRAALRKRGLTMAQVGELAPGRPVSYATISRAISKNAHSADPQVAVARALNLSTGEVFGKHAVNPDAR